MNSAGLEELHQTRPLGVVQHVKGGPAGLGVEALHEAGEGRADVVLLDGNNPELATIHDPWQQVVYCATARCVSDVWVDGLRRVRDGEVEGADVPALAAEAREAGAGLVRRAGMDGESVYAGDGRAFRAEPPS